jgi:hypothetical protein
MSREAQWARRFDELAAFVRSEGRMPNEIFATAHERTLRSWISSQRLAHAGLGTASLTADQEQVLETIPGWEW